MRSEYANLANTATLANSIADNTVNSAKIVDGSVNTADIANGAITNVKVANGAADTQAKVPWAPRVNVYSAWLSNPKIIGNSSSSDTNGDGHVDLSPYSFVSTPVVTCVCISAENVPYTIEVNNVATSGFDVKTLKTFSGSIQKIGPIAFLWMAVGY
jgi:hypothetical protein